MTTENYWVGLDLGLRETHVCITADDGKTVHEQTCETNVEAIGAALAAVPKARIGLIAAEAGSDTFAIRKLRAADYPIALFEARKASKFLALRRNKTDASDAKGLADMARLGRHTVSQVYVKSLECQQLRSKLVVRQKLVRLRVATEGAIRSRLALYGRRLKRPYAVGDVRACVEAELDQLKSEEGIDLADDLAALVEVSESLRSCVRKLDRNLERQAKDHPVCRRLMQVAGVGPICSLSFFSAIEDPHRFKHNEDVGAYLGLNPRRYQSGETSKTRGITKTGSKLTRTHLVNAALVFSTCGPQSALKDWAAALKERIGARRARVAVARKLAIVLLTLWKTGSDFEAYPSPNLPAAPRAGTGENAGRTACFRGA